jgi:transcriptional regulator with XRE-family HTH domain
MRRPRLPKYYRSRLIIARESAGLTRPELARLLHIHRAHLFKIELGQTDPPPELMLLWLKALNLPTSKIDIFQPHPQLKLWTRLVADNKAA